MRHPDIRDKPRKSVKFIKLILLAGFLGLPSQRGTPALLGTASFRELIGVIDVLLFSRRVLGGTAHTYL